MKKINFCILLFTLFLTNCSKSFDLSLLEGAWLEKTMTIDGVAGTIGVGTTVTYYPCSNGTCSGTQSDSTGKVFFKFSYIVNKDQTITINSLFDSHELVINELTSTKLNVTQTVQGKDYVADFVRK